MDLFIGLLCVSILAFALVDCWFRRTALIARPVRLFVGLIALPTMLPFVYVLTTISRLRYS